MKKLIISSVLGVALAASTAFGQGYITFGGSTIRDVWDATGATAATDSGFDATFLWSASSTTSPLAAIMASTSTNGTAAFSYSAAWADIESGGWTAATTSGAGVIGQPSNATGTFQYDTLAAFGLDNTSPGEAINLFVIAWEGGYSTLAAAEAANAPIGWTSVFSYTLNAAPPGASSPETVLPEKFGIGFPAAPTPEPTTLALAGLGGLSMLFLRRKKA